MSPIAVETGHGRGGQCSDKLRVLMDAIGRLSGDLSLDVLLAKAMDVCTRVADADRTSLFLYDRERDELWSKVAQGIDTLELRFPAGTGLAGVTARSGEILNVADAYDDPRFNRAFDTRTGYRTRSVLCVPMKDVHGKVLGVIQVLNKAGDTAFDGEDEEMLLALGAHFAVFIENSQLYESIARLFEAFVRSSSTAIDERDPATAGHSRRVAKYALNLARAVHEAGQATYTRARLRQLRYAALLHDFGKIGVREAVLMKRFKLSEDHEDLIGERFQRIALEGGAGGKVDLHAELELVRKVNRAGFVSDEDVAKIAEFGRRGLLTPAEVECLSVRRGNLTPEEWCDMRSHADRSHHILSEIPWPDDLARVPEIAHRHHEKLDGTGYPGGLHENDIDIDARILEVADIYDALTAQDRPYKPAMPHEKARKILTEDAAAGKLDRRLVDLFFERNLHQIELTGDTQVVTQVGLEMGKGIEIDVVGDSSLFTALGKGVGYLVRANGAQYMLDCGATPFLALGHQGIKELRGLIATHSHEDHRRWFTDLVLYMHYHPDLRARLNLVTAEAIHEEYEKNSKGALERSLSMDSRRVVDVPYSDFVEKTVLGPHARYRIEARPVDGGQGRTWRVVEVASSKALGPDRAKVFINPKANRPRMLFKDPQLGQWVEPENYYPFSSTAFYEKNRNDLVDKQSGLVFRAAKAAAWHGPPTIGIVVSLGKDRVAFSSDTVYDPGLWQELVEERRPLPKGAKRKAFDEALVIEDDINEFVERIWGRERYDAAMACYDGAVVIHDADFEHSVVHTAQSKFSPDSDWLRLILTHTPDGFASIYPITLTGKKYRVLGGELYENVAGGSCPLDADLYFKDRTATLWVGYRDDEGGGRLWETPRGLAVEMGDATPPGECRFLGRYRLYVDLGGRYAPAPAARQSYRVRADGEIELVTETDRGSSGVVVADMRSQVKRAR